MESKKKIPEPKIHHYIPVFILKRFLNENNQVNYWNLALNELSYRSPKSIFNNENMYRDEINHPDDPTIIERKFSKFEQEIAELIANKIIDKPRIVLTRRELEMFRIFLELLSFRSDFRLKQYKSKQFTDDTKRLLKEYEEDGDFENLWKKELFILTECRNFKEIETKADLDPIIKTDFMNSLEGYFMTIVDARGGEFILNDTYPTLEIFPTPNANLTLHAIFPISPTRAILLNHIMFKKEANKTSPVLNAMKLRSKIKGTLIKQPVSNRKYGSAIFSPDDLFTYTPVKAYEKDVCYMNALVLNETRIGLIYKTPNKVFESVRTYNERDDTKLKFHKLEGKLANA